MSCENGSVENLSNLESLRQLNNRFQPFFFACFLVNGVLTQLESIVDNLKKGRVFYIHAYSSVCQRKVPITSSKY